MYARPSCACKIVRQGVAFMDGTNSYHYRSRCRKNGRESALHSRPLSGRADSASITDRTRLAAASNFQDHRGKARSSAQERPAKKRIEPSRRIRERRTARGCAPGSCGYGTGKGKRQRTGCLHRAPGRPRARLLSNGVRSRVTATCSPISPLRRAFPLSEKR